MGKKQIGRFFVLLLNDQPRTAPFDIRIFLPLCTLCSVRLRALFVSFLRFELAAELSSFLGQFS
jgi:hypothetical protein